MDSDIIFLRTTWHIIVQKTMVLIFSLATLLCLARFSIYFLLFLIFCIAFDFFGIVLAVF